MVEIRLVTSNIKFSMSDASFREDTTWIKDNFDPDFWVMQETRTHYDRLEGIAGYNHVADEAGRDQAILWKPDKFKLISNRTYTVGPAVGHRKPRVLTRAHLTARDKSEHYYVFSMHNYHHIDYTDSDHHVIKEARIVMKAYADIITEYAKRNDGTVLWGGDFNVDWFGADLHNYWDIFANWDLVPIYKELGAKDGTTPGSHGKRLIDVVGTHKADARVKAKSFRISPAKVNSDHNFVLGVFSVGVDSPKGSGDNPPVDEPVDKPTPPKPVKAQKTEADTGHDASIDHTDCCGGREIP